MGTTDSFRFIPLTVIPLTILFGATRRRRSGFHLHRSGFHRRSAKRSYGGQAKRAHLQILAQAAKSPQAMMAGFFKERNSCKHWPKRVPGAFLSSMFY
jgi:hypothetical protein